MIKPDKPDNEEMNGKYFKIQKTDELYFPNISKSSEVNSLMTEISASFPTVLSVAVNAAGITRDNFLLKMDEESFDQVIAVNLKVK